MHVLSCFVQFKSVLLISCPFCTLHILTVHNNYVVYCLPQTLFKRRHEDITLTVQTELRRTLAHKPPSRAYQQGRYDKQFVENYHHHHPYPGSTRSRPERRGEWVAQRTCSVGGVGGGLSQFLPKEAALSAVLRAFFSPIRHLFSRYE